LLLMPILMDMMHQAILLIGKGLLNWIAGLFRVCIAL